MFKKLLQLLFKKNSKIEQTTIAPVIDIRVEADAAEWKIIARNHTPKMTWAQMVENNRKVNAYFDRKYSA